METIAGILQIKDFAKTNQQNLIILQMITGILPIKDFAKTNQQTKLFCKLSKIVKKNNSKLSKWSNLSKNFKFLKIVNKICQKMASKIVIKNCYQKL